MDDRVSAYAFLNVEGPWSRNLEILPDFPESWIMAQLKNVKSDKAYKYFIEGYVQHVFVLPPCPDRPCIAVRAKCLPSQSKGHHILCVVFSRTGIQDAYCGCPAGLSGSCHHVGALLRLLFDMKMRGMKEIPEKKSCTDELCSWIVPAKTGAMGHRLSNLSIQRHKKGIMSKAKEKKPVPAVFDPRATHQRTKNEPAAKKLYDNLKSCNPTCAFISHSRISLISGQLEYESMDNSVGNISGESLQNCGSNSLLLAEKVTEQGEKLPLKNITTQVVNSAVMSQKEKAATVVQDITSKEFLEKVDHFVSNVKPISKAEQLKIVVSTLGQNTNRNWCEKRIDMVTASLFGRVRNCKKPESLVKQVLYPKPIFNSESINYGRLHEDDAVQAYINHLALYDKPVQVYPTGLFVDLKYPFIGASPDRMVLDKDVGILEVKCPISKKGITPLDACKDKTFCCELIDGEVRLKTTHHYYFQVQGQMAVTGCKWCDFVVWTNCGDQSVAVDRIQFNEQLWNDDILPSILHFYRFAVVPEIITKRILKCGQLYQGGTRYVGYNEKKRGFYESQVVGPCQLKLRKLL